MIESLHSNELEPVVPALFVADGSCAIHGDGDDESVDAGSIVVGLTSQQCVCVSGTSSNRRSSRSLLVYDLEDELPIDGDALAIAQIDTAEGAFVVACDGDEHWEAVANLEDRGYYVRAITPLVFLALGTLAKSRSLKSLSTIIWQSGNGIDIVTLSRGKVIDWRWIAAEQRTAAEYADSVGENEGGVCLVDVDVELSEAFAGLGDVEVESIPLRAAAEEEADRIANGLAVPMIDLRNGPLESSQPLRPIASSLRLFIVCFFALQACVVGAIAARSSYLRSLASQLVDKQEAAFETTFPGERVPVGIISRLQSEQRRLAGTRGVSGPSMPQLRSAIPISHKLLSSMPEQNDATYWLSRLELQPDAIGVMEGEAESYGDLELIAERMRIAGLDVPPVSATQTSKGVSLRFEEIGVASEAEQ